MFPKTWQTAESMYLKAKRPELALKMFRDARMWHDALRIAEDYLPSKVQEIHLELAQGGVALVWRAHALLLRKCDL